MNTISCGLRPSKPQDVVVKSPMKFEFHWILEHRLKYNIQTVRF